MTNSISEYTYRYSSTMEPHNKTERKRESKLKPPKSYLSKVKPPPSWQRRSEEEAQDSRTPDIVSSCDSKVSSHLQSGEKLEIIYLRFPEKLPRAGLQSGNPQPRGDEGLHPGLDDSVIRLHHLPAQGRLLRGPGLCCRHNSHRGISG